MPKNRRRYKPWTDEEVKILVEFKDRLSIADLAKYLGRTYGSVSNKWREVLIQVEEENEIPTPKG